MFRISKTRKISFIQFAMLLFFVFFNRREKKNFQQLESVPSLIPYRLFCFVCHIHFPNSLSNSLSPFSHSHYFLSAISVCLSISKFLNLSFYVYLCASLGLDFFLTFCILIFSVSPYFYVLKQINNFIFYVYIFVSKHLLISYVDRLCFLSFCKSFSSFFSINMTIIRGVC
jgi:hypothetical protein